MENRTGAPAPPAEESVSRARGSAETVVTDVKQAAKDVASTVKHAVQDETDSVKQKAMTVIGDAQTKVADQTRTAATKLRETANGLNGDLPWMKTALEKTAEGFERLNSTLDTGDVAQLFETVKDFARRQPAVFLGLSIAAGFALARVGKTALDAAQPDDTQAMGAAQEMGNSLDTSEEMTAPYAPGTGV